MPIIVMVWVLPFVAMFLGDIVFPNVLVSDLLEAKRPIYKSLLTFGICSAGSTALYIFNEYSKSLVVKINHEVSVLGSRLKLLMMKMKMQSQIITNTNTNDKNVLLSEESIEEYERDVEEITELMRFKRKFNNAKIALNSMLFVIIFFSLPFLWLLLGFGFDESHEESDNINKDSNMKFKFAGVEEGELKRLSDNAFIMLLFYSPWEQFLPWFIHCVAATGLFSSFGAVAMIYLFVVFPVLELQRSPSKSTASAGERQSETKIMRKSSSVTEITSSMDSKKVNRSASLKLLNNVNVNSQEGVVSGSDDDEPLENRIDLKWKIRCCAMICLLCPIAMIVRGLHIAHSTSIWAIPLLFVEIGFTTVAV
jgi:hypothetical protein